MAMRFGLRVPLCAAPGTTAEFIGVMEAGGFDYAWLQDSQLIVRDVWATLGVAANRTARITLGTNVTNPITRHPTVTACAAATIDEESGGRFVLGIGSGDAAVRQMGWKTARMAQLREAVEMMRPLWEGRSIAPYGREFRLQCASGRRIPVYISAGGPKMLQLAGEIADGVITAGPITRQGLDYTMSNVEIGARRAGRRLDEIDFAVAAYCQVGDDWDEVKRQVRPTAGWFAMRQPERLHALGVAVPDRAKIESVYPNLFHALNWDEAIEACDWVPDELIEEFCAQYGLMGSSEQITARIRELAAYGVTNLYIRGLRTHDQPVEVRDTLIREVIPRFAEV